MVALDLKVKKLFFDRNKVLERVNRMERRELSRAGAFVQKDAKRSIRRRKKSARKDRPPTHHMAGSKDGLRKILFGLDERNHGVVIGPIKLNSKGRDVPNLMEFGGMGTPDEGGPRRRYVPHPFMGPAKDKNAPKFPNFFAGGL